MWQLDRTLNSPQSVSRPHPYLLIGGGGERKTLRLVAQYADACNLFASSPEDVAHKLDVLGRHCDDLGRDYESILRTHITLPLVVARDRAAVEAKYLRGPVRRRTARARRIRQRLKIDMRR